MLDYLDLPFYERQLIYEFLQGQLKWEFLIKKKFAPVLAWIKNPTYRSNYGLYEVKTPMFGHFGCNTKFCLSQFTSSHDHYKYTISYNHVTNYSYGICKCRNPRCSASQRFKYLDNTILQL